MADQFETLESAYDFVALLGETVAEAKRELEGDVQRESASDQSRRLDALRVALYSVDKLEFHVNRTRGFLTIFAHCDGSCSRSEEGLARRKPQPHNMRVLPCELPICSAMIVSRPQHFRSPSQPNPSWEVFHVRQSRRLNRTIGATGGANYEGNGLSEVRRNWVRNLASSQRTRTPYETEVSASKAEW